MTAIETSRSRTRDFGGVGRPGLDDWLTPPKNRWAFRHARELFWSERVAAPTTATPLTAMATAVANQPDLTDYLERNYTDAMVVLSDGRLAYEWYADGVRPDETHLVFSVTKSVCGLVAASLIAEGSLDPSAGVVDYLPEVAGSGYGTATVRDVLDMTAAVAFTEDYDGDDIQRYRKASGQIPSESREGIHEYVSQIPGRGAHGEAMQYISPTADIGGWLCERATGRSLADLIGEYVWTPMGGEADGDLLIDRYGASRASGGLCAAPRDMARIGHLLLSTDGHLAATFGDIKIPGSPEAWNRGTLGDFIPGAAYRDFWYQLADSVFMAAGIFGQRLYIDVERRVVIAQLSSLRTAADMDSWTEAMTVFAGLAQRFSATQGIPGAKR